MVETIEGSIYAISKDRKSIQVNNIWLHNYVPLKEDITKNINYKITYTTKKVDDKEFHNIKSMVVIPKEKTVQGYEFKQTNGTKKEIPNQTENTAIMCAKDILVAEIKQGDYNYSPEEFTAKVIKLTNDFITAYKQLYSTAI